MTKSRTEAKHGRAQADEAVAYDVLTPLATMAAFARDFAVPTASAPAVMSGRHELVALARPTDLKADEVAVLYRMIGVLLQTNAALRTHAERLSVMTDVSAGHLRGFQSTADKIGDFANFRLRGARAKDPGGRAVRGVTARDTGSRVLGMACARCGSNAVARTEGSTFTCLCCGAVGRRMPRPVRHRRSEDACPP